MNDARTKCIPEPGDVVYFPFFILFAILFVFVMIGYFKNKQQMMTTTIIKCISLFELPMYIVMIWSADYISSDGIMIGAIAVLLVLVLLNVVFFIVYYANVVRDQAFKHWKDRYTKSSTTIAIVSLVLNFKLFR